MSKIYIDDKTIVVFLNKHTLMKINMIYHIENREYFALLSFLFV